MEPHQASRHILAWTALLASVSGCFGPPPSLRLTMEHGLIGTPRDRLEKCAGPAKRETATDQGVVLTYYGRPSLFETRAVSAKGSQPLTHPMCRADVRLVDGAVADIFYTSVPYSGGGYDLCDAVFESCVDSRKAASCR